MEEYKAILHVWLRFMHVVSFIAPQITHIPSSPMSDGSLLADSYPTEEFFHKKSIKQNFTAENGFQSFLIKFAKLNELASGKKASPTANSAVRLEI